MDYRLPDKLCEGRRPSPTIFMGIPSPSCCFFGGYGIGYPLVNVYITMERSTIVNKGNSTNWMAEWPCSIAVAMLVITI